MLPKVFFTGVELPLERLNYYNGQRLEAADLRLEQDYHIRVRRWLNRSLHTWGIAAGLEVTVKPGDAHKLLVDPGLALDDQGREIILLEQQEIGVIGTPSTTPGVVFGNYLTIRYSEEPVALTEDGCAVPINGGKVKNRPAWGGPARLRAEPLLEWTDDWPTEGDGRVVIAQVELDATCKVVNVRSGVRKYVAAAQPARALVYALEGEKDVDPTNSKRLFFHIRGGRPDTVTLYLRGDRFSTTYYTELGRHTHGLNLDTANAGGLSNHTHTLSLGSVTVSEAGGHGHTIKANVEDPNDHDALEMHDADLNNVDLGPLVGLSVSSSGQHTHTVNAAGGTADAGGAAGAHDHSISGNTQTGGINSADAAYQARTGVPRTYLDDLRVVVDGTDLTNDITNRLGWAKLGDGTSSHPLVTGGTGPVPLELLGLDLSEGEHVIELRVGNGGGRVLYNLYVE